MKTLLAKTLPLVFLLTACATTKYEAPTSPSAPTLTFVNSSTADVAVFGYENALECKKQINISTRGARYLSLGTSQSEKIRIHPNEPFSFLVSMRAFPKECFLIGTIFPKDSTSYKASAYYDGAKCYLTVKRIQDGIEYQDSAFVPRVSKMPLTDSFSACVDKIPNTKNSE